MICVEKPLARSFLVTQEPMPEITISTATILFLYVENKRKNLMAEIII